MAWIAGKKMGVPAILMVAGTLAVFASTPTMGQDPAGASAGAPTAAKEPEHGAQILSDTGGVDFSGYLRRLNSDLRHNWLPLVPAEANAPLMTKGVVSILFSILPDGSIGSMQLEKGSGTATLDRAAWSAITSEGEFPPLPNGFHGAKIELRMRFFYNTPPVATPLAP